MLKLQSLIVLPLPGETLNEVRWQPGKLQTDPFLTGDLLEPDYNVPQANSNSSLARREVFSTPRVQHSVYKPTRTYFEAP